MAEECLICNSKIEYLPKDEKMECMLCHKLENSKSRCEKGHYICNECHMEGINTILDICIKEKSANPYIIIDKLMSESFCHMHGPEHHILVGASLLTAYKNAGGKINLQEALIEMINRGKKVPGGICGFWGACGAGISTGIFISIISNSTPLSEEPFKLSNWMTSKSLNLVGKYGGPRCCKRDSFLSILAAIDFVEENFNIKLEKSEINCKFSDKNNQCLKNKCPFYFKRKLK